MTPTRQSIEVPEEFFAIAESLRTQDNLCTGDPVFMVQENQKVFGMDEGYSDQWMLVDDDGENMGDEEFVRNWLAWDSCDLSEDEFIQRHDQSPRNFRRCYYRDNWLNVTACFTRAGAEDYIKRNGHNLRSPRIYVASGYRNEEWIKIREWLMSLNFVKEVEA